MFRSCRLFLIGTLVLAPTAAWAVTATIPSAADAFVTSQFPDNNYGGAGAISVSAAGTSGRELFTLLRFDLASTLASFDQAFGAGHWTLDGASLQLTAASPSNQVFNSAEAGQIGADWLADDSWVEGTGSPMVGNTSTVGISLNLLPALVANGSEGLGLLAFDGSTSDTATYDLVISPGFLADVQAGGLLSILLSPGDAVVSGVFNSRNFAATSNHPYLILSAVQVPEPATTALAGIAIIGMLSRRRSFDLIRS
jgi:hypothetical protein